MSANRIKLADNYIDLGLSRNEDKYVEVGLNIYLEHFLKEDSGSLPSLKTREVVSNDDADVGIALAVLLFAAAAFLALYTFL